MAKGNSIRDCIYDIEHFAFDDNLGFDTAVYFCTQWYDNKTILNSLIFFCDHAEDFIFSDTSIERFCNYVKEKK